MTTPEIKEIKEIPLDDRATQFEAWKRTFPEEFLTELEKCDFATRFSPVFKFYYYNFPTIFDEWTSRNWERLLSILRKEDRFQCLKLILSVHTAHIENIFPVHLKQIEVEDRSEIFTLMKSKK